MLSFSENCSGGVFAEELIPTSSGAPEEVLARPVYEIEGQDEERDAAPEIDLPKRMDRYGTLDPMHDHPQDA
jgi:hypothetical protein